MRYLFCVMFVLWGAGSFCAQDVLGMASSPASLTSRQSIRCVSLKILQEKLTAHDANLSLDNTLKHLGGLTRVKGFLRDPSGKDIVLWGEAHQKEPPLYLDNLVVALRNAWLKYSTPSDAPKTFPTCSIDPTPQTLKNLTDLTKRLAKRQPPAIIDRLIEDWRQKCEQEFMVTITGVPNHSHFAELMVAADDQLKQMVQDTSQINLPDLKSVMDMKAMVLKTAFEQNKPAQFPLFQLHRFWFSPGELEVMETGGLVMMAKDDIQLLTETQFITQTQRTPPTEPEWATAFATNFTRDYDRIADEKPVFKSLRHLFNWVTLTRLIRYYVQKEPGLIDLTVLLERHTVEEIHPGKKWQGHAHVRQCAYERKYLIGTTKFHFLLPACGGIAMNRKITPDVFHPAQSPSLSTLPSQILTQRPDASALFWDVVISN